MQAICSLVVLSLFLLRTEQQFSLPWLVVFTPLVFSNVLRAGWFHCDYLNFCCSVQSYLVYFLLVAKCRELERIRKIVDRFSSFRLPTKQFLWVTLPAEVFKFSLPSVLEINDSVGNQIPHEIIALGS